MENKKVLVIDDDEILLRLAERDLTQAGFVVLKAKTGKEGLAMAKAHLPQMILLDIQLPDIEGGEVEFRLKSDPETKKIPIIFLTGLLTKSEEKIDQRGHFYVAKPYTASELLELIKKNL